ncbi:C4-dicarboxylate ABC transporter substrate-binding protein [Pseudohoeflea suaedae]|uniref:C4-dicarboxylate ABC transporter substrate-binding protein n=1 Tax=Pseudohoeflea suaedae TaxID=877384 RepID=A0A4R5PH97_9HYPH|nr:TRAP transporter substrate-binding protein [Pseudohoeflea suaedae]TDH34276.1 C4-dicarboxylate ABC transporter substrate-binding protein [Pseudohoeflea suaedae]
MQHFMTSAFAAAGIIALSTGLGTAVAAAETTWDMPVPYGDTNFHTQNVVQFADDIKSATGGELAITVHSNGSLFKHPDIKNAVRNGLAQIGEVLGSRLSNEDPVFGLDSIPFLATSYDDAKKLYDASRDEIAAKLDAQGLVLLYSVPWPPQGIYTKKEIKTVDDLKGLKMRAYNAATEKLAQLAGAIPTQVEVPDLPTAFSTGRVEAMITSPSTGANSQVWDYLSHYSDAQAWLPRNMVFVNKAAFEALPEEQQQAVRDAAAAAEARGWEASKKETEDKTQELKDNGITVTAPSPELRDGLAAFGETMTEEWAASAGESGQAILDAYKQ